MSTLRAVVTRGLFALALPAALAPAPARADALPEGVKVLDYKFTIENRKAFEDWVLIVYPTSNNGYGYVLEEGKPIYNVMMRKGWKGPGSALYAMKKADFKVWAADATHYPHGDNDEQVTIVSPPPGPPRAHRATADISPPAHVPQSNPVDGIERTFRIRSISDKGFDLQLVKQVEVRRGGKGKAGSPRK